MQRAIMNGDEKTGITIMYMAEGMDDGNIIKQESIKIEYEDNIPKRIDTIIIASQHKKDITQEEK